MDSQGKEKTCCFTGHRNMEGFSGENIAIWKEAIRYVISRGITVFVAGGARGFDTYAAEQIIKLRQVNRSIKLILVLPCSKAAQTKYWCAEDVERYDFILEQADDVMYVSSEYYGGCMQDRNSKMIALSSYCICYLTKDRTGTSQTVDMPRRMGIPIINIAKGEIKG